MNSNAPIATRIQAPARIYCSRCYQRITGPVLAHWLDRPEHREELMAICPGFIEEPAMARYIPEARQGRGY